MQFIEPRFNMKKAEAKNNWKGLVLSMTQIACIKNAEGASDPMQGKGTWARWISEIRITWFLVLILTAAPAVLFGTAIVSAIVLVGAVVLGIPTALAAFLATKDKGFCARLCRRVVVMIVVSILTIAVAFRTDKPDPNMASPITKAIEDFKHEFGVYPDALAALCPKHMSSLPEVRGALIHPEVLYRVIDGIPYLIIPSASGDLFSDYE